jgi:hypothetical protein
MLVAWGLSDEHIAARKPWPSLPWVFVRQAGSSRWYSRGHANGRSCG